MKNSAGQVFHVRPWTWDRGISRVAMAAIVLFATVLTAADGEFLAAAMIAVGLGGLFTVLDVAWRARSMVELRADCVRVTEGWIRPVWLEIGYRDIARLSGDNEGLTIEYWDNPHAFSKRDIKRTIRLRSRRSEELARALGERVEASRARTA